MLLIGYMHNHLFAQGNATVGVWLAALADDGGGDDCNQLGEPKQVQTDPVGMPTSSEFKEVTEVPNSF